MKKLALLAATLLALGATSSFAATASVLTFTDYVGPVGTAVTGLAPSNATNGGCTLAPTGYEASTTDLGIAGLTFTTTSGSTAACNITGTPTVTTNGTATYAIKNAGSAGGTSSFAQFRITITPTSLAYGQNPLYATVGSPIAPDTTSINATSAGTISYAIGGGSIADATDLTSKTGLSFSTSTGALTGTPAGTPGTYTTTVTATGGTGGGTTTASIKIILQSPADYSAWKYSKKITVNTSSLGIATNQVNFPFLVRLSSSNFTWAQSHGDGRDIRFTSTRNGVQVDLPYQIEEWDTTAHVAAVWVLLDSLYRSGASNAATQSITMYYDPTSSATTQSDGSKVFSTSNGYAAVYHMNGNSTTSSGTTGATEPDVTGNNFHAVKVGSGPSVVTGQIGLGRSAFTTANYLKDTTSVTAPTQNGAQVFGTPINSATGTLNLPINANATVSAWALWSGTVPTSGNLVIVSKQQQYDLQTDAVASNGYYEWGNYSYRNAAASGTSTTAQTQSNNQDTATIGGVKIGKVVASPTWTYVVGTTTSTLGSATGGIPSNTAGTLNAGTGTIYVNANVGESRTFAFTGLNIARPGYAVAIGAFPDGTGSKNWPGTLDEIRISTVARGLDWIKADFQTQCNSTNTTGCLSPTTVPLTSAMPGITTNPRDTGVALAQTATFSVVASGTPTGYQWYQGTTPLTDAGDFSGTGTATLTVTGVSASDTGFYKVVVTNASGSIISSSAHLQIAAAPGQPTTVTGVAGNGQVAVSWLAPGSNGNSAITSYTATAVEDNSKTCTTSDGSTLTCAVTGLTNGTAYTFTVTATNAIGPGSASLASSGVTPRTVPDAPTSVSGIAGNGQVAVSWTASASTGGSVITSYKVTAAEDTSKHCVTPDGSTLTCTVSTLTNGTSYRFTVAAINVAGSSAISDTSSAVTPKTVPGAPTSILTTPGNGQVAVSWTAPGSNGGSAITSYTATAVEDTSKHCTTVDGATLNCTVMGLTNGTPYTFTVIANNGAGMGSASSASSATTPASVPGAPTSVSGASGNGQVTVSWTAPSNGGSAITSYTATAVEDTSKHCTTGDGSTLNCTVMGLTNGTPYTFTATATNAVGPGAASSASSAVTPWQLPLISFSPTTLADTVGKAATHTPTVSGTTVKCSVNPALPAGLALDSNTCVISGSPSTPVSASSYTVKARNGGGADSSVLTLSVVLAKPTISFTPSTVVDSLNQSATHTPATTGTITSCTATPTLPTGLNISNTTCVISGTPTVSASSAAYVVKATNSTGSDSTTLTLAVAGSIPTVSFTPSTVIDTLGRAATHTAATTGTIVSCTATPTLPTGLNLSNTTCSITGTPSVAASSAAYKVKVTNGAGSDSTTLTLTVVNQNPTISFSPSTVSDTVNRAATHTPTLGGATLTSCVATPTLPTGLSLSNTTCVISGTPSVAAGSAAYKIKATNAFASDSTNLTLTVVNLNPTISFTPSTVSDTVNRAATHTPTLGGATLTSCVATPTLPTGLSLSNTTCVISGTPSVAAGSAAYKIKATNAFASDSTNLTLTVVNQNPTISFSPSTVSDTVNRAATHTPTLGGATLTSCVSTPTLPTGLSLSNTTCVISGTPSVAAGSAAYKIKATNAFASDSTNLTLTVVNQNPTVSFTPSTVSDTVGKAATHTATLGGATLTSCVSTPTLPTGLSISNTTCVISGTPTVSASSAAYKIKATNAFASDSTNLTLAVLIAKPTISFTPSTVVDSLNQSATHTPATTGTITSCVATPTLPTGLSISNTTCVISGTPTVSASSAAYKVKATNSTGSDSTTLTLSVAGALPTVSFTPSTVTDTVGKAATHTAATTGTIASCVATPTLPTGLSLSNTTCAITGTPSVTASSAAYKVKATNGSGSDSTTLTLAVVIAKPTISFTPSTVVDSLNQSATHTPATTGTITGCVSTPTLPTGLNISNTTCVISGTPTVSSASASYKIKATNSTGSDSTTLTLAVAGSIPTVSFTPSTVTDTVGKAATHTAATTGTIASCVATPTLPTGLSLSNTTCAITGTPSVTASSAAYKVKATNGSGSDSTTLTLAVVIAKPTISFSPSTVSDTVNRAATHTPATTGTISSCVSTPTLPTGLSLSNTTCAITGTPSVAAGSAAYVVKATNSTGSDSSTLTLTVVNLNPTVSFSPSTVSDTVGKAATHTATLGGATLTSCVSTPTLPTGLSLSNTTCTITGTPSVAAGSAAYKIKATNAFASDSTNLTLAVLIAKPTISFTPSTVVDSLNQSATHTPATTGTITSCVATPTLPTGLSLSNTTCVISGTPTVSASSAAYKVKATNSTGSDSTTLTLAVAGSIPTVSFTPSTVTDTVGKAATHTAATTGTIASCVATPTLPTGLSLSNTTCAITGTPSVAAGSAAYKVKATNGSGSDSTTLTLAVVIAKPTISFSPSTVSDTVNRAATHTPATTGTISSCVSTPTLPTGLSLSNTTCAITGTPSVAAGSAAYVVKATNSTGSDSSTLTLTVVNLNPTVSFSPSTVSDTVGKAATHTATLGGATLTSCVSTPTLPTGLSLSNTTCTITGTPSVAAGSAAYKIKATNAFASDSTNLTLAVLIAKPTISFTPSTVVDSLNQSATHTPATTGTITSCVATPTLPTGLSLSNTTCVISGTPTVSASSTAYKVKATNSTGSDSTTLTLAVAGSIPTVSFTPSTVTDTVGKAATHTAATTGTIASCVATPTLPTGLSLSNTTCAITGTPSVAAGSAAYKVKATNGSGSDSTTLTLAVVIAKPTISFSPSTVSDTVGKSATHTPSTTGTISTCVSTPTLPTGLSLSNTTCAITGTPSVAASSAAYKVKVTNSTGSDSTTLTLAVVNLNPTISFTPSTVSDTVNRSATHTPATTGTITSCVATPTLPTGLSLSNTTCVISGTPSVAASSATYKIKVTNTFASDSTTLTLAVVNLNPTVSFTPSTVSDTVGKAASHSATLGGATLTSCTATPTLPTGLSLSNTTCAITGTPSVSASSAAYKIKATNAFASDSTNLTLAVLIAKPTISFTPSTVSDTVNKVAAHTPATTGTITSCVATPTLPTGLSLSNTTCAITGTPTVAVGSTAYKIKATNGTGSDSTTLTLTVIMASGVAPGSFVFRVTGSEKPYAFALPSGSVGVTERMTMSITDMWGRTVWEKTVNPSQDKLSEVSWNGRTSKGVAASAGMYVMRISVLNGGVTTRIVQKAITLKPR